MAILPTIFVKHCDWPGYYYINQKKNDRRLTITLPSALAQRYSVSNMNGTGVVLMIPKCHDYDHDECLIIMTA